MRSETESFSKREKDNPVVLMLECLRDHFARSPVAFTEYLIVKGPETKNINPQLRCESRETS